MRDVALLEVNPPPRRGEWAQSPTLPLPPPRDRGELDHFLQTLSTVAVDDAEAIRAMFADVRDREELAAVFHEALGDRPCGDVSRFMLLLSSVGELACASSLAPLEEVVWTADADLLVPGPSGEGGERESARCEFPASGMIQARAAEMFAWIAAGREDDRLLRIVAEHPSVATRLAAADACLFAYADAPDALERVLAVARPDDRSGIGVPRFVRGGDREAFDRALERATSEAEVNLPSRTTVPGRRPEYDENGEA